MEIKFNYNAAVILKQKLQSLKNECDTLVMSKETVVGDGESIHCIQELCELTESTRKSMLSLIDSTVMFLDNTIGSVSHADINVAEFISKGE